MDPEVDKTYNTRYQKFLSDGTIKPIASTVISDAYYVHVSIPSQSSKGIVHYDVVIRFFPETPEVATENNLFNYKVQFFSNSPSFMYQYAYLYKKNGYLIDALYKKLDADYINVPPEKTNKSMTLGCDISLYCACKFLSAKDSRILFKDGVIKNIEIPSDKFFRQISDFKSVRFDQSVIAAEKKLSKVLDDRSPKRRHKPEEKVNTKKTGIHVKEKKKSTTSTTRSSTSSQSMFSNGSYANQRRPKKAPIRKRSR